MAAKPNAQLVVPELDGIPIDAFKVAFSGNADLDPTDGEDNTFMQGLKWGERVRVTVEAVVTGRPHSMTLTKGGHRNIASGGSTLRVIAVRPADVEFLGQVQAEPKTLDEAIPPAPEPAAPKTRRVRGSRASRGETPSRSQQATAGAHLTPVDDPTDPPV
jgi:hypothetical protein